MLGRLQDEARLVQRSLDADPAQLYAERKRYFGRFDDLLASSGHGPTWLQQPEIAAIVKQSLHHFDGPHYQLLAYCLMPNHVHLLVRLSEESPPLMRTLQRIKGFSALQANKMLGCAGSFWQSESYDHIVRKGELGRIISYIVQNPVKAGLGADWQAWPSTYIADGLM